MAKSKLSERQKRFVEEYVKNGLNASAAYRAAGYKAGTDEAVRASSSRLLTNANVAKYLKELSEDVKLANIASAEYVLKSLREVAERCMTATPVMEKVNGKMVPTGEYRFDSSGANRALELLGKYNKLFTEKHELTGKDGGPVESSVTFYLPSNGRDNES